MPPFGSPFCSQNRCQNPTGVKDSSKTPQEAPKRLPSDPQEVPGGSQEAPRGSQEAPKRPQEAPGGSQEAPRSTQVAPKSTPRSHKIVDSIFQIWFWKVWVCRCSPTLCLDFRKLGISTVPLRWALVSVLASVHPSLQASDFPVFPLAVLGLSYQGNELFGY